MDLHKIGIKFLAEDAEELNLVELIPVFHRWIQTAAVEDRLFDVADYSHVPDGPGVMIIAHEGDYAFDESGGKRGFLYYSKHELEGDLDQRLATVTRKALKACKRIGAEQEFSAVRFPGTALEVFSNDRLIAPNTDEAFQAFEPALRRLLDKLYGGGYEIERESDPRERLTLRIRVQEGADVDTLLGRLAA